jgi:salicylate hydroxylase
MKVERVLVIGGGIILQPNGRKGLSYLGVDPVVEAVSGSPTVMHGCDYATGEVLASRPNAQVAETCGVASLALHRGDLHGAILAAVRANDREAVHAGHEFVSLEQDDDERCRFAFRALIPIQAVPAIVREREMAMHRGPDRYLLYYALRGGTLMNLIGCGRSDLWEEGQALQNPSIENRGAAGYGLLDYDPATVPV